MQLAPQACFQLVRSDDHAAAVGFRKHGNPHACPAEFRQEFPREGTVFEDRYHAHVLRTLAEARNAICYAVGNFASHAARRDEPVRGRFVDPYSSESERLPLPLERQTTLFELQAPQLTRPPRTWLLRTAMNGLPEVSVASERAA